MKSAATNIGDSILASQYNNLREDAKGAAHLLAHEQTTPDLTLKVEAGIYYLKGTRVIFATGNSPSFTAPTTNPRIDLLVIDSAGVLSRVVGTEAASPAVPTYPKDKIVICEVFNRVGQTTIRDTDVAGQGYIQRDVRGFLNNPVAISQNGAEIYAADGGSTDAYAITLDPAPAAYAVGMVIHFKANTANTGAATLNANSLGAVTIKKNKDQDLSTGDIKAGQIITVVYDGTNFQMITATPASGEGVDISFTAGENLAVGDKVGVSAADTIKKFVGVLNNGSENTFSSNNATDYISVAHLQSNKYIVVYQKSGAGIYAEVVILNSDGTVTFGAEKQVSAATGFNLGTHAVAGIATDKAVITWVGTDNAVASYVIVEAQTGNTLTQGTIQTNGASYNINNISVCKLDTDKFLSCGLTYSAGNGRFVVGTVSGTVISFGSTYLSSDDVHYFSYGVGSIAQLGTDKAVIAFQGYDSGAFTGRAQAVSVSGTVVTIGTMVTVATRDSTFGGFWCDIVCPTASNFVIIYKHGNDSNKGKLVAGTVSGTTITLGSASIFSTNAISYVAITHFGTDKIKFSFYETGVTTAKRGTADVSGNTLSNVTVDATLNAAATAYLSMAGRADYKDFVLYAFQDGGGTNFGHTWNTYGVANFSGDFIGIVQETIANGNSGKVRVKGLDLNQSGLTFGTKYWVADDGSLSTSDLGTGRFVGVAKSATAIVIK